ncbi:hypothetical protein [Mycolicibacterium sphagni]|uniref:hypothetical protein n=1 Tax=Mycolicibacterium sphagni TaxID=1786 RepID=UPI0021F2A0E0|nr:hypothetical protein [Mycolicibacterium sphagni]MCV7174842.1 hypothetical protein [Mycolicibacterium sphagni]
MKATPMWLVYADEHGERHYQPWADVATAGTLSDDDGEDMELIGWTDIAPPDESTAAVTWYRVDDRTQGQIALIEAGSAGQAARQYLEDYAPDLYATEASASDIEEWQRDSVGWEERGEAALWYR